MKLHSRALGSRLFIIPKAARRLGHLAVDGRRSTVDSLKTVRKLSLAQKNWSYRLSEENCLVLDRPEFRIGSPSIPISLRESGLRTGGKWQPADEILRVDDKIRLAIGARIRGGQMVQSWARKPNPNPKRVNVGLRYRFQADYLPSGEFHLAIEQPRTFKIMLNGIPVSTIIDSGWWCDKSLRRIVVDPALLRLGINELMLECDYEESHPGLEIVYLLGNFGTRAAGTSARITQLPAELKLSDWCGQGLAFYGGSVTYLARIRPKIKRGERLFLAVPDYRGVAVRIIVDGRPTGLIAWEPNEIDITALVANRKEALLGIEVIGHRRNSHGPLHNKDKQPWYVGPGQFKGTGKGWRDAYQLVPCGLMRAPQLVIRKP